jgi:leucyl aminopeptidase
MKLLSSLALGAAACAAVLASDIPNQQPLGLSTDGASGDRFLVETAPGETKWVSEDEKWELKRVRIPWPSFLSNITE